MKPGKNIFVVEDEAIIALTIDHTLRKLGYHVVGSVESGEECLAALEEALPDLVLMDINLAGQLDGIETAAIIKQRFDLPVVFLTAYSSADILQRARLTDPFGYLVKPFNEKDLFSTIEVSIHRAGLYKELRNSERKFRDIASSVDHIVIETNTAGKITYLNPYGEKILRPQDAAQENNFFTYIERENDREYIRQKLKSTETRQEGMQPPSREIRVRANGDRIYFFEEQLHPVVNDGLVNGLRGILFNITKRKYKEALQQAVVELSDLLRDNTITYDGFIFYLIKLIKALTGADSVYFNRYDKEKNSFFTYERTGTKELERKTERLLTGHVGRTMQPLFLHGEALEQFLDVNEIPRNEMTALAWIGIPIHIGTELFGVLGIQSYESPFFFSNEDFEVFKDCGHETSFIFQSIAFRNKALENEFRYRNLVESVDEGIVQIDYDEGRIIFYNRKFLEMLELAPEDLQANTRWTDLPLAQQHDEFFRHATGDRKRGLSAKYEIKVILASGQEKWFLISATPVYGENRNVTGSMAILLDVTEKKESERRIREGGERLDEIVRHIKEAFWLIDWKTRTILYTSPSFEEIYGFGHELLRKRKNFWFALAHEADASVHERFLRDAPEGKYDVEYRVRLGRGKVKWVHERAFPIRDSNGEVIRVAGYSLDISEQKLAQLELASSESNKKAIIDTIPDSLLIVSADGTVRDYYRKDNVGLPEEGQKILGKKFTGIFNPDNRRKVLVEFRRFCAAPLGERVTFTIHDAGLGRWFELRFEHIDEANKLILVRNVTASKTQEAELKKFFNLVEQSEEIIIITDRKGIIEYVNPKFSEVSGYSPAEVIGHQPRLLNSGKHSRTFFRTFWKTILNGRPFSGEFINRKKSGELYIEAKFVTPLFNENAEIVNFISTGRDITEQRETEQKLEAYRKLQEYQERKQARIRTLSLLQGQEEERKRIARELHDGLGQILSATKLFLERMKPQPGLAPENPDFSRVHQMVIDTIHEVRRISNDLSPSGLHDFGLLAATRNLVAKLNETVPLINFSVNSNVDRIRFKNNIEINVFRIIQEAVNNAIKHSGATKVEINLFYADLHLRVSVMDDGAGFSAEESSSNRPLRGTGNGLANMRERAKIIGGKLVVVAEKGSGSLISFELKTGI